MTIKNILDDEKLKSIQTALTQRVEELLSQALQVVMAGIQEKFPDMQLKFTIMQMYNDEGAYEGVFHFVARQENETIIDGYRYFEEDYGSYDWNASIDSDKCKMTSYTLSELLNEHVEDLIEVYKCLSSQKINFSQKVSWTT